MLKARAFAPGHVTGFFEIHDGSSEIRKRGSRGAGLCLSEGVTTNVELMPSEHQKIEIYLDGIKEDAPVTRQVIKKIIDDQPYHIKVSSVLDLPQKQGFGMSAAGGLSTALAMNNALNRRVIDDEVVCIAHEAEILCGTGLGDVVPQSLGGFVISRREGCTPYGVVENIDFDDSPQIVLCVVGEEIFTKDIIRNPEYKKRINEHGKNCMSGLVQNPCLGEFFKQSKIFADRAGLLSLEVKKAMEAVSKYGIASMSMLGNSIFAIGQTKKIAEELSELGKVFICDIDLQGAKDIERWTDND